MRRATDFRSIRHIICTLVIGVACVVVCLCLLKQESTFIFSTHIEAYSDSAIINTVFHQYRPECASTGFLQDGLIDFRARTQSWKSDIPPRPDQALLYTYVKGESDDIAERQEGIVAGFLLAALTGRNFYILYQDECPLSDFYVPNKFDWRVPSSIQSRLFHPSTQQIIAYNEAAFKLGEIMAQTNLTLLMTSDLIVFSTNQDFTRYLVHNNDWKKLLWARGMDRAKIYASVWEHLFKLTPSLQIGLSQFVDQLYVQKGKQDLTLLEYPLPFLSQRRDIGSTSRTKLTERNGQHARYTLVCGQFKMKRNPTEPRDTQPHEIREIWGFLQRHNDSNRYRIFVQTDSEDIRSQAKRLFPETLVDIPDPSLYSNLAWERADLCRDVERTLLDQLALASCDVLVRGYKSHLGAIAAYWRGLETRLYCFNSRTVKPCTMSDKGFHWGPEYTPGVQLQWKTFVREIQQKANGMS